MEFFSTYDLEKISKAGTFFQPIKLGAKNLRKTRVLSSFWLCTNEGKDGIAEHLCEDGYWESWVTLWISKHVMPGSVCIDAGATYGYYSFFLAQHGCKVYSIEANPELVLLMEYSLQLNGANDRVKVINRAVSEKSDETVVLGFSDSIGGTSIRLANADKKIYVNTIALDEILEFEPKIDFVKLDIAGSEELAWRGMQHIRKVNPACVCLMEFSPVHYSNKGRDFFNQLLSDNYVSYINHDGDELLIYDFSIFEQTNYQWQMLVVRSKIVENLPNRESIITYLQSI